VAIAATYVVSGLSVTASAVIYTVPSTGYNRDLVVTNGGPSALFVGLGSGVTAATTVNSFQIPSGGQLVLSQCQSPQSGQVWGVSAGTSATSVGYASVVSVV
jgi:hypothetical protein